VGCEQVPEERGKPISRSRSDDGYGAPSGPSRGDHGGALPPNRDVHSRNQRWPLYVDSGRIPASRLRRHRPFADGLANVPNRPRALFDLRSNGGIGGFKGRLRPRGAASGDANEREQVDENANCSPTIGHRKPHSRFATRGAKTGATMGNTKRPDERKFRSLGIAFASLRITAMRRRGARATATSSALRRADERGTTPLTAPTWNHQKAPSRSHSNSRPVNSLTTDQPPYAAGELPSLRPERSALYRQESGDLSHQRAHRRPSLFRSGTRALRLQRSALRPRRQLRLLRDRRGRGKLEGVSKPPLFASCVAVADPSWRLR
jgi:hypothetical protein